MINSLGNWQDWYTFVPKCAKNHAFSTRFELLTQCLTTNEYDPSLNCAVCSIARQVEHDQSFPFWAKTNETQTRQCFAVWMFLKVSTSKQSNQIEAIGYGIASIWTSPWKICKNTGFFWVLLINYDNFSGKLTRIVHFCAKMCRKTCVFNSFWTLDSMFDHKWIWSLSKLCIVQHCKAGWARPMFSILGKDKGDPNETVFCSLDVSLRSPLQSSPIK